MTVLCVNYLFLKVIIFDLDISYNFLKNETYLEIYILDEFLMVYFQV